MRFTKAQDRDGCSPASWDAVNAAGEVVGAITQELDSTDPTSNADSTYRVVGYLVEVFEPEFDCIVATMTPRRFLGSYDRVRTPAEAMKIAKALLEEKSND
jgi:hypothetical protein